MRVDVDEPGRDNAPVGLDVLVAREACADLDDRVAFDRDIAQIRRLTPGPVRRTIRRVPALMTSAGDALGQIGLGPRLRGWINREDSTT